MATHSSVLALRIPGTREPSGLPSMGILPGILQARALEWITIAFSNAWNWKVKVKSLSRVRLFVTPWTTAYQAPPSMGLTWRQIISKSKITNINNFTPKCVYGDRWIDRSIDRKISVERYKYRHIFHKDTRNLCPRCRYQRRWSWMASGIVVFSSLCSLGPMLG